jgi:Winged helix-turn-helix DNA-binding
MPRKPRITIDPSTFLALRIWGALKDMEPSVLVDQIVMDSLPSEVKQILNLKETQVKPSEGEKVSLGEGKKIKPKEREKIEAQKGKKAERKKLSDNKAVLGKIEKLWQQDPRPSYGKIAKEIGYPKSTIRDAIRKMIDSGKIPS